MAAFTSASFCLLIGFLIRSSEAEKNITADLGQNVTLTCKAPKNKIVTVVKWIRPEMNQDYVLLYRDGRIDPDSQHPSYQNRVDLQDKEMKDGDFSLILKNVKKEDTGTYKCLVDQQGTKRRKRSILKTDPISIINLEVRPPGDKDAIIGDGGDKDENTGDGGNKTGVIVGSVVGVIIFTVLASVGFLIYRRHKGKNPNLPVPPDEAAAEQMV